MPEIIVKYDKKIIIAGCLSAISKSSEMEDARIIKIAAKETDRIDEIFPEHTVKYGDIQDANLTMNVNAYQDGYVRTTSLKKKLIKLFYHPRIVWAEKTAALKNRFQKKQAQEKSVYLP